MRPQQPEADPGRPAGDTQQEGLHQELTQDVAGASADGETHANFARPLGHGDQHDVHDPDSSDQQRHGRHAGEEHLHRLCRLRHRFGDLGRMSDIEVVRFVGAKAMAFAQQGGDLLFASGSCAADTAVIIMSSSHQCPISFFMTVV